MFALVILFIRIFLADDLEFACRMKSHFVRYFLKRILSSTECILNVSTICELLLFLTTVLKVSTTAVTFQIEKPVLDDSTRVWHQWHSVQRCTTLEDMPTTFKRL